MEAMKKNCIQFGLKYSILFCLFFLSCGVSRKTSRLETSAIPKKLSEWNLFIVKENKIYLEKNVIPYDLINPLFSDYAIKFRTLKIPEGKKITYKENGIFVFPMHSVISKTFAYRLADNEISKIDREKSDDIIILRNKFRVETRVLVKTERGWLGLPYIWDKNQKDATLKLTGKSIQLSILDDTIGKTNIIYKVPSFNQCKGCHTKIFEYKKSLLPIGLKAKNINKVYDYGEVKENQLRYWYNLGLIDQLPDEDSIPKEAHWLDKTFSLEERARAYLDINCAHCHSRHGYANTSGLYLDSLNKDRRRLGVCKSPVAAGNASGGRLFDIVPKKPEESILYYRMESIFSEVMMPEIGRTLQHKEGLDLIYQWISNMDGDCS